MSRLRRQTFSGLLFIKKEMFVKLNNVLNKNTLLLSLVTTTVMLMTACGSDGDDTGGGYTNTLQAGIYGGTLTPVGQAADTAIGIVTSEGDTAIVDLVTEELFIGTASGNSLTGTLYASTAVSSTAEVTNISGNDISGNYTSSLGGGDFALTADPDLYSRTSDLSKLAGVWVDSVFVTATGTSTWNILADGSFTVTTGLGCNASGTFSTIDVTKNEYDVTMTLTDCTIVNGSYTGFAALSDTSNPDDTLTIVFGNGTVGAMRQPIK